MRMKIHILRLVSVFFIVLVLVGCGIMTVFTVTYAYNSGSIANSGKFTFTDLDNRLSWITPSTGPSLLLSYIVTTEFEPPSGITTKFNSEFKRSIADGRMIPSDSQILSVASGSNIYSLYKFSDSTINSFDSPHFMATANNPLIPNIEFSFSLNSDNTLQFSIDLGSYSVHSSGPLTRFNGQPFETDPSKIINSAYINSSYINYPDYVVPSTGGTLYLHIYAAINTSEGDFNNIFWTSLHYVGYIQLNNL